MGSPPGPPRLTGALDGDLELAAAGPLGVDLEVCRLLHAQPLGLQPPPHGAAGRGAAGCGHSVRGGPADRGGAHTTHPPGRCAWRGGWVWEGSPCPKSHPGGGGGRSGERAHPQVGGLRKEPGVWKHPPPPPQPVSPPPRTVSGCPARTPAGAARTDGQKEQDRWRETERSQGGQREPRAPPRGGQRRPHKGPREGQKHRDKPPPQDRGQKDRPPRMGGGDRDPQVGGAGQRPQVQGQRLLGGAHRAPPCQEGTETSKLGDRGVQARKDRPLQVGGWGGQEHRAPQVGRTETRK